MVCQAKTTSETEDQIGTPTPAGPGDKDHRSMEESAGRRLENSDRHKLLYALVKQHWEALERCRVNEEEFFEKKLPMRSLMDVRLKITAEFRKIMVELRKNEELELRKQMATGGEGCSVPPLSDPAKQALELILPQFSPEDRRVLRQILDRG